MKKLIGLLSIIALTLSTSGCATVSKFDLAAVEKAVGMKNITTGDGTFENYTATGYYEGEETGIGLGLFTWKYMELYPAETKNNEGLLIYVAKEAAKAGANNMIWVCPAKESFYGFIIGRYSRWTCGTGIKQKDIV